ncbi:MAG: phosphoadenylyl-sulfate reductase [Pseudomonadota bacterium]
MNSPVFTATGAKPVNGDGVNAPTVLRVSATRAAASLNGALAEADAADIIATLLAIHDPGDVAMVSSFGADSAVLLHMLSRIAPETPVLMLETGFLFAETLDYQRVLATRLGLGDVRLIRPAKDDLATHDPDDTLHRRDTDGCCHIRKTRPLDAALRPFQAWITGRKRFQSTTRQSLTPFEAEDGTTRLKANPLYAWDATRLARYMDDWDLPRHPLVSQGYPSIGCWPCTSKVAKGEDARAGRWRGEAKEECGIHFDGEKWVRHQGGLP